MTVLVAQLGARRHYVVPRALECCGILDRLVTDLCAERRLWRCLDASVPTSLRPQPLASLLARRVDGVPALRIIDLPLFAFSPALRRRSSEAQADYWARRNRAFCREVVRRGFGKAQAVYAFNGAALEIFEAAKGRGLATMLDQTAAPWRWNEHMLREEMLRWPGWEDQPAELDSRGELARREEREWQLADTIICGSDFAAESVVETGGPNDLCTVVPYPAGTMVKTGEGDAKARGGALKVLFVGTLQLRKGVQYLFEAARHLKGAAIDIRLVGPSHLTATATRQFAAVAELAGPASRADIGDHYAWADVLVLPTLSEGSANVVHEAMAGGLAVVTTPSAGSRIRGGYDGLIVSPRDSLALANAIRHLADDCDLRTELGRNARLTIMESSFDGYARRLASICGEASPSRMTASHICSDGLARVRVGARNV